MAKAKKSGVTMDTVYEAVARNLREFGYPDVTAAMIREIYTAYEAGTRGSKLPHGVIGMMAEGQFDDNADLIARVKTQS